MKYNVLWPFCGGEGGGGMNYLMFCTYYLSSYFKESSLGHENHLYLILHCLTMTYF